MSKWKVRKESYGEFIVVNVYDNMEEAYHDAEDAYNSGYWDEVDVWEVKL